MAITTQMIKDLRERTGSGIMDCKKALNACDGDVEKAVDWLREKGIVKAAKKEGRIAAEGVAATAEEGDKLVVLEVNVETDFAAKNKEFAKLVDDLAHILVHSDVKTVEEAQKLPYGNATVADAVIQATAKIGEKISFRRFTILTKNADEHFGSYIHMGGKIASAVIVKGANKEVADSLAVHVAAFDPMYLNRQSVDQEYLDKENRIQLEAAKNDPKLAGKPEAMLKKIVQGKVLKGLKEICLTEQAYLEDSTISVGQFLKNNNGEVVTYVRYMVGEGLEHRSDDFAAEVAKQMQG